MPGSSERTARRRPANRFHRANLALALLVIVPFFLVPTAIMVVYSFGSQEYLTGQIHFGWSVNAWERLNDSQLIRTFLRSVELASLATVACAVIGYPLAYFVARHAGRFKAAAVIMIIAPFWVSFIVRAYAWLDILGDRGPINRALEGVGLVDSPVALVNNEIGIAIGMTYSYLPLMVFPLYVTLERMDRTLVEASKDLGAGRWGTFRQVTLPIALPGLVTGSILVFIPMMGEYVIPQILGYGRTYLMGNALVTDFLEARNWPSGSARAVFLIIIMVITIAGYVWFVNRGRKTREVSVL
jgi:spermidine/putrescine transport system permease protein